MSVFQSSNPNTAFSNISILNEGDLVSVLEQASNIGFNPNNQKLAEQQLKVWETQKGFHYHLQSIYLNLSMSLQIRWLAVIQFKNGIEKYWRSTRINAIDKEEKNLIRDRLFNILNEQNNQLCIQNAQAVARIARLDFPTDWSNLFENIHFLLEKNSNLNITNNKIECYNLLIYLNQIIKILGAARIGRCKPAMQSKMPLILQSIIRIYLTCFNNWTKISTNANELIINDNLIMDSQLSYIALKVLRRIINDGYENPQNDESICEFLKLTLNHLEFLIENLNTFFKKIDQFEKFIKCYNKIYYKLVINSPINFILLPNSIEILNFYSNILINKAENVYHENSDIDGDFWEQISIKGFLILKKILNFINKKGVLVMKSKNEKQNLDLSINKIVNCNFFNEQFILNLLNILINWYLKLRPSDLNNWFSDPEEWINEQISSNYEYQIRPCAENFFQDLLITFSEILVPYLLNKIQNDTNLLSSDNTLDSFLLKDSLFSSFQLSASVVGDMVDFDKLLIDIFLPEATNINYSKDQLKILRRRVSLIINEWSIVKCSEESKKICYQYFINILSNDDDKVVQITTIQSLRTMIDDWNFKKENFQFCLDNIVKVLLTNILPNVSLTETRLYVLNTLSDIIVQTQDLISNNLLIEILQIIPKLWEISSNNINESILSNALLRLLKHLVTSLGPKSYLTWNIAIPAFTMACNPQSPQYQLLNEDGYDLWSSLLQNFSEKEEQNFSEKFIEVLPFLEFGVEMHSEILPTLLEIVKSYSLILNHEQFFQCPSFSNIFGKLCKYLLKLRDDSYYLILEILEILIISNESDFETQLLQNFYSTGILNSIFNGIFQEESLSNHQCGQLLQLIARICYVNPNAIIEFLQSYHTSLPNSNENLQLPILDRKVVYSDMPFDALVNKLVSIWILCYKDLYDPKFKKLHILGLSSLLRTGIMSVLAEFSNIASLWIEILEEINETNAGDCEKYHLNDIVNEQSTEFYRLTPEQFRKHNLDKSNDPVHNISIKEFFKQTMHFLESHLGEERYKDFMASIPEKVFQNLNIFLSIAPSA